MRTKISMLCTAAAAVLCLTAPADAQLLGGGLSGGVGGAVGGGLGGGLGGALPGGALSSDVGGHLSGSARATGGLDSAQVITQTRDAAGRPLAITRDARGRLFATTLDARGRVLRQVRVSAAEADRIIASAQAPALPAVETRAALPAVDIQRRQAVIGAGVVALPPSEARVYMDRQVVELRRELAGVNVTVERRGDRIVLLLPSDITFAFDKSTIQPRFRPVLDRVARTLRNYPSTYVDITGHTDAVGSDAYNQRLSERRADSVVSYLEARGNIRQRVHAEGRGEQDPVASNATISGRAANRRVEIELTPVTA